MRNILAAAALMSAVLAGIAAARADDAETIAAVNKAADALDAAFEQQDAKAIEALVTPEHIAVTPYYRAPQSVAAQIESLPDLKYEQKMLDAPKVTLLGPDAAIRTFTAELKGTYKGRPIPSPVFVTAIMVKSDGAWREKFYQVTRMARERVARRHGRCHRFAGTYLTKNTADDGSLSSRSLLSLDRGGLVFFSDSGEGGEPGYAPFSAGQGSWRCVAEEGAVKARAVILDFTLPKNGTGAARIGRLELDLEPNKDDGGISGTATLTLAPIDSDGLKPDGDGRKFKVEGERVRVGVP